jgi:hypothetical protein
MFNTNNDSNLKYMFGLVLWCLTPLSTIFQLFRGGQFLMVEETGRSGEKLTDNFQYQSQFVDTGNTIR